MLVSFNVDDCESALEELKEKNVRLIDAPNTWWSLVEIVSWDAWVTPHVPQIMPECTLKPPEITGTK